MNDQIASLGSPMRIPKPGMRTRSSQLVDAESHQYERGQQPYDVRGDKAARTVTMATTTSIEASCPKIPLFGFGWRRFKMRTIMLTATAIAAVTRLDFGAVQPQGNWTISSQRLRANP